MLSLQLLEGLEAGTDEAGRGCLAGPVTAAAVILPPDFDEPLLNDSKKLTEKQIKDEEIWFCTAPFQMIYTSTRGELLPCSWAEENIGPNIKNVKGTEYYKKDSLLNARVSPLLNSRRTCVPSICFGISMSSPLVTSSNHSIKS